jgi:hypothetical protein
VPYSVGDDELRIVASQDLGELGRRESAPVLFHWRWYYHVPALPLWAMVLLLLVVPKANRHRQAWLIFIPLGLVLMVWRMPATLFSMPDGATETLGALLVSGTMAWSMVWLLGHWLGTGSRVFTTVLAWGVMFGIGLLAYRCYFADNDFLVPYVVLYGFGVALLLLAMMLAAYFCRRKLSLGRFVAWLLLSNGVVIAGFLLLYGSLMMFLEPGLLGMVAFAIIVMPVTPFVTGVLYLPNLPFLVLAFKCPFYRQRFDKLFRIETRDDSEWEARMLLDVVAPLSTDPTSKPVTADDLIGRWEFYVDRASVTMRLDLRPDGTFGQTMIFNRGGMRQCAGGTWKLEGPLVQLTGYHAAGDSAAQPRTWWMVDTQSGLALRGSDDPDGPPFCIQRPAS